MATHTSGTTLLSHDGVKVTHVSPSPTKLVEDAHRMAALIVEHGLELPPDPIAVMRAMLEGIGISVPYKTTSGRKASVRVGG